MIYNEENLEKVSKAILNNLTPDLIPVKWRQRNSINPMFGHCYTASACLFKSFRNKRIKTVSCQDWERFGIGGQLTIVGRLLI